MRILVYGQGNLYEIGGVQLSYQWLFEYLCAKGHEILFLTHVGNPGEKDFYYKFPPQVEIEHYKLAENEKSKKIVREKANSYDPDVILVINSSKNALIVISSLYDLNYPLVLSERGSADYCLQYLWNSRRQRHVAHYAADFTHFLMPSYVEALPAHLRGQVRTISSLTQAANKRAAPDRPDAHGRYKVIYAGRYSFEKDLDLFIEAFSRVAAQFPDWVLETHGTGPDGERLREIAARSPVANRISIGERLGGMEQVYDALSKAHLFVLPSRAEGCPLALREAMAHGLPVIGFQSCSGTNEIISHGQNGLLAHSNPKLAGLSEAIADLMASPETRVSYGKQGIEDVKQYEPAVVHKKWEDLLAHAAKYKGHRRQMLRTGRMLAHPLARSSLHADFRRVQSARSIRRLFLNDTGLIGRRGARWSCARDYMLLYGSVLFDPLFYAREHYEVKKAGVDPLLHYLLVGWQKGLAPSEHFDPTYYSKRYMNGTVDESPLVHFYRFGRHHGAQPKAHIEQQVKRLLDREIESDSQAFGPDGIPGVSRFWKSIRDCADWVRLSTLIQAKTHVAAE